jgi:hypothetical protein
MNQYADLTDLPHPADITSDVELVGLYMKVYCQYVKLSMEITSRITGDLDQNRRLGNIAAVTETPLIQWLETADDYMPEWFDANLLEYPGDGIEFPSEEHVGHKDVWIEVDGHQQRVLGDPNMSEETKKALAAMIKAATEAVERGDFDND